MVETTIVIMSHKYTNGRASLEPQKGDSDPFFDFLPLLLNPRVRNLLGSDKKYE
jgi:hypothetical protein